MRDALQHQPHESIDARGMAIALLCWGEGVTPRDLVLSLLGDGPGSDRIIVHKTALITLPHGERVKQIPRLEEPHNSPDADKLPPGFWGAICGTIPPEQVDPDTRRFLASLFEGRRKEPDPNEQSEGATIS